MALTILALNCTLKHKKGEESSTEKLLGQVLGEFKKYGAEGKQLRLTDYNILPGVKSESEGPGDEWPEIRKQILAADILVMGTPIWMGQPSSVCKRALERMDAFLSEKDEQGRLVSYGKIAVVAVVGNEDGAHHSCAEIFQSLNDVGFTVPASGCTYWVGEAMGHIDYKDLKPTPEKVTQATAGMVRNAAHLAQTLKANPYPGKD